MYSNIAEINPPEVTRWVCLVKQGDERAALCLFDYCRPVVTKVINSRLPLRTCHEDVEQEVFGKIFTKIDQYSGKVPLLNWVSRIAVNTCINLYRKQEVRPELRMADLSEELEKKIEPTRFDHLSTTEGIPAKELVHKLLENLKPNDRRLIDLLFVQGHTYPEVVKMTGLKLSFAKTRIFRLRQKLANRLETLLAEPCHVRPNLQPV
jgi:RNA polymerase sigma-70 factor (ECF subfamily)